MMKPGHYCGTDFTGRYVKETCLKRQKRLVVANTHVSHVTRDNSIRAAISTTRLAHSSRLQPFVYFTIRSYAGLDLPRCLLSYYCKVMCKRLYSLFHFSIQGNTILLEDRWLVAVELSA